MEPIGSNTGGGYAPFFYELQLHHEHETKCNHGRRPHHLLRSYQNAISGLCAKSI
jgi:hypothetical protein